jgi:hypothetical protein
MNRAYISAFSSGGPMPAGPAHGPGVGRDLERGG